MSLADHQCHPCTGDTLCLDDAHIARFSREIPAWTVDDGHLTRVVRFADFAAAMEFVNRMASLAEAQGHHPDFSVHYDRVRVEIWTHVIGGLSENDFVLAAKIDGLLAALSAPA